MEKPIKTIKTMIFKLSPGATPPSGDSLKIMVFMVFIGFSKVFGLQNTETLEKPIKSARRDPKTLEKPIKVTHKEPRFLETVQHCGLQELVFRDTLQHATRNTC